MTSSFSAQKLMWASLAALLLLLLPSPAFSQAGEGTVRGTVLDQSGASVPAAPVTLTNRQTGVRRQTNSTSAGIYVFPAVPPGPYTLTVQVPGFKQWSGQLDLQVGQTATANPQLEVGAVDTIVEVSGAASVIQTETSEIADVKDAMRIRQLPLNGRAVSSLFSLTPGVEGGTAPRVNGLKVGSTEMLLDGMSVVDRFAGGLNRVQPGLDTIQEFRIETAGSGAQFSRPATVSLVTKSGTNELHGSIFWTHRNNGAGLRALTRQERAAGEIPKLIRNEFGASAGGPIYIPKVYNGQNKTFWFAAYEGMRQREETLFRATVPAAAWRQGDFSNLVDAAGRAITIYDPLTTNAQGVRQPFPNNRIPTERFSPFAQRFLDIIPLPTSSINPLAGQNFDAVYPRPEDNDQMSFKLDHSITSNHSLSGRYTRALRSFSQAGGRFGAPPVGCDNCYGSGRQDNRLHNGVIRYTGVFTPTLVNEVMLAANRSVNGSGTLADSTNWGEILGLPNPFNVTGWPTTGIGSADYLDADNRKDQNMTAFTLEDNVTWIKGSHTVKFGGRARRENNNIQELQQAQGSHEFGADWTSQYDPAADQAVSFTGEGFASMLLGLPTYLSNQANRGFFYFEQQEYGLYVQDDWKVSDRLTLNLGLRWDKWTPYNEKRNRFVQIDLNTIDSKFEVVTPGNIPMEEIPGIFPSQLQSYRNRGLTWTTADAVGMPSRLLAADNNNFGPRLGAAYRLTNKMVLRGSYGEYFWTMPLSQILQTMRTNPPLNLRYTNQLASNQGTDSTFALKTVPGASAQLGNVLVSTEGVVDLGRGTQSGLALDGRNWKDARSQTWNATLEREIFSQTAVRLSYIGNHGSDLEQRFSVNPREPEYNYVLRTGLAPPSRRDDLRVNPDWSLRAGNRTGFSNTHSGQVEVERRFAQGLGFQFFYTFSRSLTTTDAGGSTSGNGNINSTSGAFEVPTNIELLGSPNLTYDERLRLGYYNSSEVPAHRIRYNWIYDLPLGRGKKFGGNAGGFLNQIIGGWQVAGIGEWRSGQWLGVNSGRYLFGDPTLDPDQRIEMDIFGRRQRLWFRGDFDPAEATNVDQQALQQLVPTNRGERVLRPLGPNFDNRLPLPLNNGTTRLTPVAGTVNWNARNFYKGPGLWNVDASLFKHFYFSETTNLRVTADFFNVFNSPMDVEPNTTTGLQDLTRQANAPRVIQFSLRLTF